MKIRIGVLFGGRSVEHEVSIITALQAINHMDKEKYEIVPIYIDKRGIWYTGAMLLDMEIYKDLDLLKRYAKEVVLYNRDGCFVLQKKKGIFKSIVSEIDLAFPIMHGTNGEDGTLQGYLETIGIPYCESDTYSAVVGQDKVFMKQIWKACGVPIVKFDWFFDSEFNSNSEKIIERLEKLGYPMIVKPARLGSSVGIKVCKNEVELYEAIEDAINYDNKILVEEVVNNLVEVNISVLGNYQKQSVSVIEEVGGTNDFLTYEDKYISGAKGPSKGMASAIRIIPARISEKLQKEVEDIAVLAYKSLNSTGVVRIDFLIDSKEEKVYANEINSIPGSLAYYLWEKTDKTYQEELEDILTIAVRTYKNKNNKIHSFDTNILSNYSKNAVKGIKGGK